MFSNQVHTIVLKNQWKTLVHTLVAAVIADQPAAARANDEELLQIARRITAVSYTLRYVYRFNTIMFQH
jgi:hypothetical protein